MKSIEVKIAEAEAEWLKNRYLNRGVRESADRLFKALRKSSGRRINCALKTLIPPGHKTGFKPGYVKGRENLVVSLTSTKDRIRYILPTIRSLTDQSRRPDLIVLWLGKNGAYPKRTIQSLKKTGICIRFREDLGPYTKYFYAFDEFKEDLIITVDDDVIYHRDMVKELYETHLKHPEAVTARRVHKIRFKTGRQIESYRDWIWEYGDFKDPSFELFATGTGGVLYPLCVTGLKAWENRDFLKVCPGTDDVWLKYTELKGGIRVCGVSGSLFFKDCINLRTLKTSLASVNVDRGGNDASIKACARYFGMEEDLCERILGE